MPKGREQPAVGSLPDHLKGSPQTSQEGMISPKPKRQKVKPTSASSPKLNRESHLPDTLPSCSTIDKNDMLARRERKTSSNEV